MCQPSADRVIDGSDQIEYGSRTRQSLAHAQDLGRTLDLTARVNHDASEFRRKCLDRNHAFRRKAISISCGQTLRTESAIHSCLAMRDRLR
jgi:hypothetical protein